MTTKKITHQIALLMVAASLLAACSENQPEIVKPDVSAEMSEPAPTFVQPQNETALLTCEMMAGMTSYCGFQNPEDMIVLSDEGKILVSEMGEFMLDTPGQLSVLDLTTGENIPVTINWIAEGQSFTNRGDESCPAPDIPAFSPHGIDLTTLADGSRQVLVVNHGGREAVEFFELTEADGSYALGWRGCAIPPGDPFINDVAGTKNGGFFVTHMWDKSTDFEEVGRKLMAGETTGWVYEWHKKSGFTKVPNSDQLMPNGIAINDDNSKIFVNIYMGNKTIKMDAATGNIDGEFAVRQPDNITLDSDGNLWVASHNHDALNQNCAMVTEGPCLLPFEIIKANADTLTTEVFLHQEGPPMGYATVALKVGDRLLMGSAHGDRVVSVAIP